MRIILLLVFLFLVPVDTVLSASVQLKTSQLRPVNTYSIVARDPQTGEMGVAVQSHWFAIGSLVPWAEAGVGVVATQSYIDVRYGTTGLKMMRDGWNAEKTLAALVSVDPHAEVRQVAMLDVKGNVAVHTGDSCIEFADHKKGNNYSIQANLMLKKGVVDAMEKTYLASKGSLAERLLKVLEAAQAAGGDARGKQSAAIVVVKEKSTGRPWEDRVVDLHVEDHPHPLKELGRLFKLQTAYEHMNKGDLAIEQNNIDVALEEYTKAGTLLPGSVEIRFWHAVSLVNAGRLEESIPLFRQIFQKGENWRTLVRRIYNADILKVDEATVGRILAIDS